MLIIRQQQIEALSALDPDFENRAVPVLRDALPEIPRSVPDSAMKRLLRLGVERAAEYGIDDEESIILYTAFMALYGVEFDRDPALPWARGILDDVSLTGPDKIELLYDVGADFEAEQAGEEGAGGI